MIHDRARVARWFIFKPKIPIWVNFGVPWIGKCWYILWQSVLFYGHLGYSMTIWSILCLFGSFFRFVYHVPRKIWQPWTGQRTSAFVANPFTAPKNIMAHFFQIRSCFFQKCWLSHLKIRIRMSFIFQRGSQLFRECGGKKLKNGHKKVCRKKFNT
jgi:hypothetical protein